MMVSLICCIETMSAAYELHQAPSAADLAQDLADWVAGRLAEDLARRGQALLVVSGGSTPVPFFEALRTRPLDWSRVTITLADERWVSRDDQRSNELLVRAHLLQGPVASAKWVSLTTADESPALGCETVEWRLKQLPWPATVTVLGMGGDGHTASLFPVADERVWRQWAALPTRCMPVGAPAEPNVPVPRISLTPSCLLDARALVVHATGAAKWPLWQRAEHGGECHALPIRFVLAQQAVPVHLFYSGS